jgi:hypothetical protein
MGVAIDEAGDNGGSPQHICQWADGEIALFSEIWEISQFFPQTFPDFPKFILGDHSYDCVTSELDSESHSTHRENYF